MITLQDMDALISTGEIPDFPEKGKYHAWTSSWEPNGLSDEPQYAGQQPIRFPLDWTPAQCALAAHHLEAGGKNG